MTHPNTLIPRAVVEQALKKHETNCCMFERGVQTLDDVLASRATFLAALQPQADTSVLQAAPWPPSGDTQTEPEAMRHDFDGYGWKYIDNGSGSDWMTRHPEGEFLFTKPQALQPQAAVDAIVDAVLNLAIPDGGDVSDIGVQAAAEPVEANNDEVICPNCCNQFRAIPVNVQRLMLDAGFEPPSTTPPATQAAVIRKLAAGVSVEPVTSDNPDFMTIPVEYQYAYPDGTWRCSNGDAINGMKPTAARALYARKDSQ